MIFLVGFRVGLNVTNSNVIDVGYAGVIGADKLLHDQPLYGNWPTDNGSGDTYGPVAYYAYVPFRMIFGWSGTWDDLPAAHAAAILFDLLTLFGLYLLGRRVRGPTLGVVLAYAWAAYPFTLWTLSSNTQRLARGAAAGAGAARDHLCAGAGGGRGARRSDQVRAAGARAAVPARSRRSAAAPRSVIRYVLAYGLTAFIVMLPVLLDNNWPAFWRDTIAYQAGRTSPFTIWGLWGGLDDEQHLFQGPRCAGDRGGVRPAPARAVEVAALGAAVLIALQLSASYWLYSYIVWFFPWVIVAVFGSFPSEFEQALSSSVDDGVQARPLAVAGAP